VGENRRSSLIREIVRNQLVKTVKITAIFEHLKK
jgi:hypothetical protein